MKVVAFNGSPNKDGNTSILINYVLNELKQENIETEMVQLGKQPVRGCSACYKCVENQNKKCVIDNDIINSCIEKMVEADGIIIGSPTYFSDVTTEVKALIDRAGFVTRANGGLLKRKLGAAIVAVRRAGAIHTFNSINHFFLIGEMVIPGSSYWNIGVGRQKGEVENDEEGIETMKNLGQNMAWLLNRL